MEKLTSLPGFRDFYPDLCAVRNYVFHNWRETARTCGFTEYEIPILEPTDLYRRKSGDEIVKQLFHFTATATRPIAQTRPQRAAPTTAASSDTRRHPCLKLAQGGDVISGGGSVNGKNRTGQFPLLEKRQATTTTT